MEDKYINLQTASPTCRSSIAMLVKVMSPPVWEIVVYRRSMHCRGHGIHTIVIQKLRLVEFSRIAHWRMADAVTHRLLSLASVRIEQIVNLERRERSQICVWGSGDDTPCYPQPLCVFFFSSSKTTSIPKITAYSVTTAPNPQG